MGPAQAGLPKQQPCEESFQQKLVYPAGEQRHQCYNKPIKVYSGTCTHKNAPGHYKSLYKEPNLIFNLLLCIPKRQLDFQLQPLF